VEREALPQEPQALEREALPQEPQVPLEPVEPLPQPQALLVPVGLLQVHKEPLPLLERVGVVAVAAVSTAC